MANGTSVSAVTHSLTCRTLADAAQLADTLTTSGHASEAITDSKGRATLLTSAPAYVLDAVLEVV